MKERRPLLTTLGIVLLVAALSTLAATPAAAAPPKGKHYAIVLMLADPDTGELAAEPGCLSFSKTEVCTELADCGPWEFVRKAHNQNEWKGTLEYLNGEGMTVRVEAHGITERFGTGSSIGGTAFVTVGNVELNAGFAGTRVSQADCLEFGLSDD